jgi:hypothetical protein
MSLTCSIMLPVRTNTTNCVTIITEAKAVQPAQQTPNVASNDSSINSINLWAYEVITRSSSCACVPSAPLLEQHFRRDVVGRANCRERQLPPATIPTRTRLFTVQLAHAYRSGFICYCICLWNRRHVLSLDSLAQAKVRELDVAISAEQQVVGLDVPESVATIWVSIHLGHAAHRICSMCRSCGAMTSCAQLPINPMCQKPETWRSSIQESLR